MIIMSTSRGNITFESERAIVVLRGLNIAHAVLVLAGFECSSSALLWQPGINARLEIDWLDNSYCFHFDDEPVNTEAMLLQIIAALENSL